MASDTRKFSFLTGTGGQLYNRAGFERENPHAGTHMAPSSFFFKTINRAMRVLSVRECMKGKQPEDLRSAWKSCAEKMGYHWAENSDPALPFDGLMYHGNAMVAVRLKKVRYGIGNDCIIEQKFPEDVVALRSLPLPPYVVRELWIRTQNERAYRRFYVLPGTTAEIEENTKEGYRNIHYREAYWKKAPFRRVIPLRKEEGGEKLKSEKPYTGSVCQTDDPHFRLEWK